MHLSGISLEVKKRFRPLNNVKIANLKVKCKHGVVTAFLSQWS